ncbi:hypothetical protein ScPMuIL_015778 [Solemya velum]
MFVYIRLTLYVVLMTNIVLCQTDIGGQADKEISLSPIEDTVINSLLRIVDNKFDSLSGRITSLERSVSSLQYYNIRQFRQVSNHLMAVDTILQATHTQVGQVDIQSRGVKVEINALKQKIDGFQQANSGMHEAMEQYVALLDAKIVDQVNGLHGSLQEFFHAQSAVENITENEINCETVLQVVEEKFDLLLNKTESISENLTCTRDENSDTKEEEESRKAIVRVISTLNDNVVQSLKFHRHSGNLIERVVAVAENVQNEQELLRSDVKDLANSHNFSVQPTPFPVCSCPSIDVDKTPTHNGTEPSPIIQEILENMKELSENSTGLVDLLSEIAQLSRVSLKSTVLQLGSEISNLQGVSQEKPIDKHFTDRGHFIPDYLALDLESLLNKTEGIFQIAEAVAANTGWIPHIFHNLMFVESQVNKTLSMSQELVSRLLKLTLHVVDNMITSNDRGRKSYILDTLISPIPAPPTHTSTVGRGTDTLNKTNKVFTDLLISIHRTSNRISRILPGLTRLVGEPEPYITLMDGDRDNEGRVEIYFNGRWGSICDDLGHTEATYICRRLGYTGGVVVAGGQFGAGEGVRWRLNVTCLYEQWCDAVSPMPLSESCDHESDFSVICDHMVRLSVTVATDDVLRNLGSVQIHNNGAWIPVCAQNWGHNETIVACKQLGFQQGASLDPQNITTTEPETWMQNTKCNGNENRLSACQHEFSGSCANNTIATIVCD